MASSPGFRDRMLGALLPFGPVRARAMFGGYGLYLDGVMFALIAYDTLYFKVDDGNRGDFLAAGMRPFTYQGKRRPVEMSYYAVPPRLFDDPGALAGWADGAHRAAQRARRTPPRRRR